MVEKYRNSLGFTYAEECVPCPHKDLCFQHAVRTETAIRPGWAIYSNCWSVKNNPEFHRKFLDDWKKSL